MMVVAVAFRDRGKMEMNAVHRGGEEEFHVGKEEKK